MTRKMNQHRLHKMRAIRYLERARHILYRFRVHDDDVAAGWSIPEVISILDRLIDDLILVEDYYVCLLYTSPSPRD